jgi:hypothetical protein
MGYIAGQQKHKDVLLVEKVIIGELVEIKPEPNRRMSELNEFADQDIKKPIKAKKRRYQYRQCEQFEYTATNLKALNRHKSEAHKNHDDNGGVFLAKDIVEDIPGIEIELNITIPETAVLPDQEDEKPTISKKERCHPCDKCEYSATNTGVLYRHKRTAHTNQFFNCEQCNYTTNRDDTLLRHNRTMHN